MKVPKYIAEALEKRANFAYKFNHYDYIITQFIIKNRINAEEYDYCGGCESIVNPSTSSERVYQAILNSKKE